MAFMALFGWIFLLMIPAFFIGLAMEAACIWAKAHPILISLVLILLIIVNLLILRVLLRGRKRWKQEGKLKRSYLRENYTFKVMWGRCLYLCAPVWVVMLVALFAALLFWRPWNFLV